MAEEAKRKRYAMAVDTRRCTGCMACQVACKSENGVALGVWRTWVANTEKGEYPNARRYFTPRLCNHCDNPPCVRVCPVKATYKREDGVVLIDQDRCIGCKFCIAACPYNARFVHPDHKVVDKCTFCAHRVDQGIAPACVNTCMGKARIFGDLNDPKSEISKVVATNPVQVLKPEKGTKPQNYYISSDFSGWKGGE